MEWMPYEKALPTLSYPNEKDMLTKAWNMIQAKANQAKTQPPTSPS
jgi:hypothetical protein